MKRYIYIRGVKKTYDLQVLEVRVNVAVALEESSWRSPARRVRVTAGDVRRDRAAREEPDADGRAGPFGRVHATTVIVESSAVRRGGARLNAAACVGALTGRVDVAVGRRQAARKAGVVDGAARAGVKGHGIVGVLIDTLDDIDFTFIGPVWAHHPAVCSLSVCLRP